MIRALRAPIGTARHGRSGFLREPQNNLLGGEIEGEVPALCVVAHAAVYLPPVLYERERQVRVGVPNLLVTALARRSHRRDFGARSLRVRPGELRLRRRALDNQYLQQKQ